MPFHSSIGIPLFLPLIIYPEQCQLGEEYRDELPPPPPPQGYTHENELQYLAPFRAEHAGKSVASFLLLFCLRTFRELKALKLGQFLNGEFHVTLQ